MTIPIDERVDEISKKQKNKTKQPSATSKPIKPKTDTKKKVDDPFGRGLANIPPKSLLDEDYPYLSGIESKPLNEESKTPHTQPESSAPLSFLDGNRGPIYGGIFFAIVGLSLLGSQLNQNRPSTNNLERRVTPKSSQKVTPAIRGTTVTSSNQLYTELNKGTKDIYLQKGTYVLNEDVTIKHGTTLTLEGGHLKFGEDDGMVVYGTLQDGALPITFTSDKDKWKNITILNGELKLNNSTIERGRGNTLTNNRKVNNKHTSGYPTRGGGIHIAGGEVYLGENTVIKNNSTSRGGGIYISNGELTSDAKITNNRATEGGGVYVMGDCTARLRGLITENFAKEEGGGLLMVGQIDPKRSDDPAYQRSGVTRYNLPTVKYSQTKIKGNSAGNTKSKDIQDARKRYERW